MKKLLLLTIILLGLLSINLNVYAQEEIPTGFGGDEQTIENLDEGIIEEEVLEEDASDSVSEDSQDEFIKGALVGVSFGAIVGIILGWLFKDRIV